MSTTHHRPLQFGNDLSYRLVVIDWPLDDLILGHQAAIRQYAAQDLSVAYPREHLVDLEAEGVIGRLAPKVVSMIGAISARGQAVAS